MSQMSVAVPTGKIKSANETKAAAEKISRIVSQAKSKRARLLGAAAEEPGVAGNFSVIVHCHLCWDWVWQRPQQFLSRLSARHKILFVETVGPDPQLAAPYARFRPADGFPNITILRIQFPTGQWNDGAFVDRERRR